MFVHLLLIRRYAYFGQYFSRRTKDLDVLIGRRGPKWRGIARVPQKFVGENLKECSSCRTQSINTLRISSYLLGNAVKSYFRYLSVNALPLTFEASFQSRVFALLLGASCPHPPLRVFINLISVNNTLASTPNSVCQVSIDEDRWFL